ncbi:MAG: N-6 DNA methylase [Gammaproteobacteria bacterium]|nr:N-6 DNA methylase [Gammaproteobacteria bacterium]
MPDDGIAGLRAESRAFEKALPQDRRKALGQFFTGRKVSAVLAHLANRADTERVLDPMAGTGDLLDAVYDASTLRGNSIRQLHAIEIDDKAARLCQRRLNHLVRGNGPDIRILRSDAFDPATHARSETQYDLVIANPPYVRYQSMRGRTDAVRRGVARIASQRLDGAARTIWTTLADGYSGLADLSIPSCLLCALFVRPGGRLALVIPATWRSRSYADVVRYLLLRAFRVEVVVEDSHGGWFPDALVGTHLVVARRLHADATGVPLRDRTAWSPGAWFQIHAEAESDISSIGRAFPCDAPEAAFASWALAHRTDSPPAGIAARKFDAQDEWASLRAAPRVPAWLTTLEPSSRPVRTVNQPSHRPALGHIPETLRDLMPPKLHPNSFRSANDLGIHTGQGLRTGCNRFFYVDAISEPSGEASDVTTHAVFDSRVVSVPTIALKPVLHRQAELAAPRSHHIRTHVLDLRHWVLPEDMPAVNAARTIYQRMGEQTPGEMPEGLAEHVRSAACTSLPGPLNGRTVSALSAVRTNIRPARANATPRFWYMLPAFAPRHMPDAFVPRVNYGLPRTYVNTDPKLLIDANFSSLWSDDPRFTADVLAMLFNSAWCVALMEAGGTRLGGGALKLEASHLSRLPLPSFNGPTIAKLQSVARERGSSSRALVDRVVLGAMLPASISPSYIDTVATALLERAAQLRKARRGSR